MNDFGKLQRLLYTTSMRQSVLSSNIANADTPNFKARDIKFNEVLNGEMQDLAATHPRHIKASFPASSGGIVSDSDQPWNDGNDVELEREVAKMTENALLHQAGVTMLATKIKMFKNALRRT